MRIQEIQNIRELSNLLRCRSEFIGSIITNGFYVAETFEDLDLSFIESGEIKPTLHKFYIPKRNISLGYRTIFMPFFFNLSNVLKILNNHLSDLFTPPENVHGFVKNKNIKTNAANHLAKKYIVSLDIKDFFESISTEQIQQALVKNGISNEVAKWISLITTVNGYLVQGFHTSPTIANMVTESLDIKLRDICRETQCYTRYADDMYFSSDICIPNIALLRKTVEDFGFMVNDSKTQIMKRGQKQYVTGLTVFDNLSPRISRKVKRNLRLEIYFIVKFGYQEHILKKLGYKRHQLKNIIVKTEVNDEIGKTKKRLWGWIHFIQSIEPELGFKFERQLRNRYRSVSAGIPGVKGSFP